MMSVAQFHRILAPARPALRCFVDGRPISVFEGDTVLTAVLSHRRELRSFELSDSARSGFCLMGACQDCWVADGEGTRIRACSTLVSAGLHIMTGWKGDGDVGR